MQHKIYKPLLLPTLTRRWLTTNLFFLTWSWHAAPNRSNTLLPCNNSPAALKVPCLGRTDSPNLLTTHPRFQLELTASSLPMFPVISVHGNIRLPDCGNVLATSQCANTTWLRHSSVQAALLLYSRLHEDLRLRSYLMCREWLTVDYAFESGNLQVIQL